MIPEWVSRWLQNCLYTDIVTIFWGLLALKACMFDNKWYLSKLKDSCRVDFRLILLGYWGGDVLSLPACMFGNKWYLSGLKDGCRVTFRLILLEILGCYWRDGASYPPSVKCEKLEKSSYCKKAVPCLQLICAIETTKRYPTAPNRLRNAVYPLCPPLFLYSNFDLGLKKVQIRCFATHLYPTLPYRTPQICVPAREV